jgi:integrase
MGSRYSMTLKSPTQAGAWKDRIRLPEDVRLDYQAQYGPAWEEKFHRSPDTPPDKAVAEHAAWAAKVKGRIAALRASKAGKGVDLTQKQAAALAGDWYREFTSQHQDNPGNVKRWSSLRETLWDRAALAGDPETGEADFGDPEVLRGIEIEARASQFLTDRGVALTPAGRTSFLSAVVGQFLAATEILERRARDDWGLDQHLDQLAPSPSLNGQHSEVLTGSRTGQQQLSSAVALFEAYCQAKQIKPRTIDRWRCVFTALDALPEAVRDQRGAQRWLDGLVGTGTPPRKHRTVRDIWLSASSAVYAWGVQHGHVATNPFKGCVVEVPRKNSTRETGRAFNDGEARIILAATLKVVVPLWGRRDHHWAAVRRWVPWLCAYTGARVGEITQLRMQDIELRDCGPVLRITPDAGTQKTGQARWVPVHPHVIENGFLAFIDEVKARMGKRGPLFYQPPARPSRNPNYRGPAVKASERLAAWVRELGVTDRAVQPNHGWRHSFRTRAARPGVGIEERMRGAICGHAPRGSGQGYEHPTVADMADALKHFPPYEVK